MGTFAETAVGDYFSSFTGQGKLPFSVSVCTNQMEVFR
jgi:hypothetical protein